MTARSAAHRLSDGDDRSDDQIVIPAIGRSGELYPIGKLRAHEDAVLHLAVSVFVFCGNKLLLQQRATSKYHCGGLWANTCCSHPDWGESLADCARRRLTEELGFSLHLEPAGELEYRADVGNGLIEHEKVSLFVAAVGSENDICLVPNPDEVKACCWADVPALCQEIAEKPDQFTPWLRVYAKRLPELARRSSIPATS